MNKKSFKNEPALQFMSGKSAVSPQMESRDRQADEDASGPILIERKSKRFNMLMRPSLFERLRKESEIKGLSVNELMNVILEGHIEKQQK
ncbi:MAG: hypothetical protein FWC34_00090 [Bacteroidetes bacterium]|nr:hypothetical protein [Bacteroidota bacterium]